MIPFFLRSNYHMATQSAKFRGRIKDYGVTQSKVGQQHATVYVDFNVIGQYDPATGELLPCEETTTGTYYKAITPKTIEWLAADLKAIGYDRPGLEYLDPETPGAVNLFDREIDVDCQQETYQGQTRNRWSIHRDQAREKLGRDDLARLDAMYGDQFRRVLGAGDTAVPPPPVADTNDDTPF
jgi:hypothetical protein